ncbi:hypothetical protein [Comamonas sp. lk]|uniref:hypothetical protein n=1 Tax=Comamonas sp. lk TaxID=2201272 RepID=UPI000EB3C0D8|nr:hypothetical protein [Comamonas sp. lk]
MMRNPEFQRQLWLNWRPSLLAWSLGFTALILMLPLALSSPQNRGGALGTTALVGLWAAAALYGSVLAGRSLGEEANQNPWDWQRLSALSPWQMAWGKLLGAALPAWLYTLWFALALLFVSTTWVPAPHVGWHTVGLAVLWGLALQSWAMNSVLMSWGQHDIPVNRRRAALLPLLLLFFLPGPFLGRLYQQLFDDSGGPVLWWGLHVGSLGMAYLFGAQVLGLGLLALWRQLCTRLDVRTLPWAWPLGLAVSGWFAGGTFNQGLSAFWASTAWLALLGTVYVALQHMDQHLRAWRQVQWSASRGRWREMFEALPLWPVSLALAFAASVLVLLTPGKAEIAMGSASGRFALFFCLQLLRDCLLLTGFALLVGKLKSPMTAFVIAWLIINIAAPLLAFGVAGHAGATLVQPVIALLYSSMDADTVRHGRDWLPWMSLGLQTLLALGWVIYIFRDRVLGFARESRAHGV